MRTGAAEDFLRRKGCREEIIRRKTLCRLVIARSETTKQSPKDGDCFASLAMTFPPKGFSSSDLLSENSCMASGK